LNFYLMNFNRSATTTFKNCRCLNYRFKKDYTIQQNASQDFLNETE
jgi:hypothetical protein